MRGNIYIFNITYPAFAKIKNVLSKIHILLTPNEEHRKVFPDLPVVGFWNGKSLKDILVRAKLPSCETVKGYSKGCQSKRCDVCNYVKPGNSFGDREGQHTYEIRSNLNCN